MPDAFPITLDLLTVLYALWLIFAFVSVMLFVLFGVTLALQMFGGTWKQARTRLTTAIRVGLAFAGMTVTPFAGALLLNQHIIERGRTLDTFPVSRCLFADGTARPDRVAYFSDNQVLACFADRNWPAVVACRLAV